MIYRVYSINGGMQTEMLQMPKGADIVSVSRSPENRIQLVALVDEQQPEMELCRFKSITTNTSCDHLKCQDHEAHYLGTVYLPPTNWHVHRLCPIPKSAPAPLTQETSEENIESSLPSDTVVLDEDSAAEQSAELDSAATSGTTSDGDELPATDDSAQGTDTDSSESDMQAADSESAAVEADDASEAVVSDTDTNPFN